MLLPSPVADGEKVETDSETLSYAVAVTLDQPRGDHNYQDCGMGRLFLRAQETLKTANNKPRSARYQLEAESCC